MKMIKNPFRFYFPFISNCTLYHTRDSGRYEQRHILAVSAHILIGSKQRRTFFFLDGVVSTSSEI